MANILVVEDEVNVSSFIKRGFEEEGHSVDVAYDGAIGRTLVIDNQYDAIVLDLILPNINGIELCKEIRKLKGYTTPIIMLTAIGSSEDIVQGLNIGADDYMVKPFKFQELLARINSLLRGRNRSQSTNDLSLADLTLNGQTKKAERSGEEIVLTSKEYRLLEYFLKNQGRVLSRTSILENVWDNFGTAPNVVDVYVNYLRNKIDKDFEPKLIHTIIGMGYVMKEN
jgi:two-component system, OmpR family, copper resistance phosphate regulon response regulator CusR